MRSKSPIMLTSTIVLSSLAEHVAHWYVNIVTSARGVAGAWGPGEQNARIVTLRRRLRHGLARHPGCLRTVCRLPPRDSLRPPTTPGTCDPPPAGPSPDKTETRPLAPASRLTLSPH